MSAIAAGHHSWLFIVKCGRNLPIMYAMHALWKAKKKAHLLHLHLVKHFMMALGLGIILRFNIAAYESCYSYNSTSNNIIVTDAVLHAKTMMQS